MPFSVSITDDAARDLDEVYAHTLLHDAPGVADQLLDRIQVVLRSLAADPTASPYPAELSPLGIKDYRSAEVDSCRIVYRTIGKDIFVLLIADRRRDLQPSLIRRLLEP